MNQHGVAKQPPQKTGSARADAETAAGAGARPRRQRQFIVMAGIFLLALGVRLAYLYESTASPTFATPVMDAHDYDNLARSLLSGQKPHTPLFWQAPFYALFLAGVYLCLGVSIVAAKVTQIVLGAGTCVLTYALASRVFDRRTGILAGISAALYGPLIFFDAELMATGWAAFFAVALTLLFVQAGHGGGLRSFFALGSGSALMIVTRPDFVPAVAASWAWLAWTHYRCRAAFSVRGCAPAKKWGAGLVGFFLAAIPLAALSCASTGRIGLLPASGGINFYIGNSRHAAETIAARPGRDWQALMALPEEHGVTGDMWAQQRFYYTYTLAGIREQPLEFVRGLAQKGVEFVTARELPRSEDIYVYQHWSHVLRVLTWKVGNFGFPFGVLLPLAVVGLVRYARRIPAPVWLMLVLYPLAIVLIFNAARYRAPLIPILAVPAAAGLLVLVDNVRTRRWQGLAANGGLIAVTLVCAVLPGPFKVERINYDAELYLLVGNRLLHDGRPREALERYREGLRFDPESPDLNGQIGKLLLLAGRPREAVSHYENSLRSRPGAAPNHASLGLALLELGELERAIEQYSIAVELDPAYAQAWSNLGAALQKAGRLDAAIDAYTQAARLSPQEQLVRYNLGVALARRGDLDAALRELIAALAACGEPTTHGPSTVPRTGPPPMVAPAEVHYELALVLARLGRRDDALVELDGLLRLTPDHQAARTLMQQLRSAAGP